MNKTYSEKNGGFMLSAGVGVLAGYIALFVLLFISAIIMTAAKLTAGAAVIMATVSLCAAGLLAGVVSSKKYGSRVLVMGAVTGLAFYISVALVSVIITRSGLSSLFIWRLILTVAASSIGSVIGALKQSNKKMI